MYNPNSSEPITDKLIKSLSCLNLNTFKDLRNKVWPILARQNKYIAAKEIVFNFDMYSYHLKELNPKDFSKLDLQSFDARPVEIRYGNSLNDILGMDLVQKQAGESHHNLLELLVDKILQLSQYDVFAPQFPIRDWIAVDVLQWGLNETFESIKEAYTSGDNDDYETASTEFIDHVNAMRKALDDLISDD